MIDNLKNDPLFVLNRLCHLQYYDGLALKLF